MLKSTRNVLLLLLVSYTYSCSESKKDSVETKVVAEVENSFNSDDYDFVLPQPISLAKAFQAAGLSYFPGMTNAVENEKNYSDKVKQLLNLGVYSTDLAYCAINEKAQEARGYLNAIQNLGNQVGLKPVFSDKKIIEKFDSNLNNMEAIEDLIYDIQERSEEYMQDNDIRYLSIVQFSGAWTEGMYLGVKDIEMKKGKNDLMSLTIIDQINLLKNILVGIKTYPTSDQILSEVSKQLTSILDTYNHFESVVAATKSETLTSPKLSAAEFATLSGKIKELRNYIVK